VAVEAGVVEARGELAHGELLGRWARRRREELDLTQEQVAERMGGGITGNWVTRLETGRVRNLIPQPTLGRLAAALETGPVDLLLAAGVLPPERFAETATVGPNVARLRELVEGLSDECARELVPVMRALIRLVERPEPGASLDAVGRRVSLDAFPRRSA